MSSGASSFDAAISGSSTDSGSTNATSKLNRYMIRGGGNDESSENNDSSTALNANGLTKIDFSMNDEASDETESSDSSSSSNELAKYANSKSSGGRIFSATMGLAAKKKATPPASSGSSRPLALGSLANTSVDLVSAYQSMREGKAEDIEEEEEEGDVAEPADEKPTSGEKPVLLSYTSFTQAADENAMSRVYVGFHFRNATAEGTAYGRKIGERAATLLPATK